MTSLPVTWITWGGALLPVVLLLVLLVKLRWSAVDASVAGVLAAALVAFGLFRAPVTLVAGETAKGIWNSLSIMAVTFPAILIYEVSAQANCFAVIQRELTRLIPDRLLQVLALGWCFASFLQGPSGFGVPIAVTAPLLIGIGVKPVWAVVVPLMAHAWANTFGTLGLGWEALVVQTDLAGQVGSAAYWSTAWWTGLLTGLLCVLAGALICWFYKGWAGLRHGGIAVIVFGGIQAGGQLVLSQITPTLCAVIPTTLALGAAFCLARLPRYARPDPAMQHSPMLEDRNLAAAQAPDLNLHQALLPYYVLVVISVVVLMTPPLNQALSAWKTGMAFPASATGYGFANPASDSYAPVSWLTHSGFFLLLAALAAAAYYARLGLLDAGAVRRIGGATLRKSVPAALSVVFLVAMSKIMGGSGQVDVLAHGTAGVTGPLYAGLAPLVGMLGAFMSSSNVSSNILFGGFQQSMAGLIGASKVVLLAAQTSGAAVGTMFSPSKVLLGATTAGIAGQEGAIIRKLLGVAVGSALLMGVVVLLAARGA